MLTALEESLIRLKLMAHVRERCGPPCKNGRMSVDPADHDADQCNYRTDIETLKAEADKGILVKLGGVL